VLNTEGVSILSRDGDRFVAFGGEICGGGSADAALVWTATDALAWMPGSSPRGNDPGGNATCPGATAVSAVPGGSGFVAIGTDGDAQHTVGRVWHSQDGARWSLVPTTVFDNAELSTVASGRGVLVAGGGYAHLQLSLGQFVAWSRDGTNWRRITLTADGQISYVVTGPAGFVAVGHRGSLNNDSLLVWFSADGEHWAQASGVNQTVGNEQVVSTADGYSILAADETSGAKVLYESHDGHVWTRSRVTGLGEMDLVVAMARIGSRLIAIGAAADTTQAMWVSDDAGHAWQPVAIAAPIAKHTTLTSILVSGHDIFVGGGYFPTNPISAKPASVPRIWSVTID
jgi:hypothetical protein